jgi:hypothetical protein
MSTEEPEDFGFGLEEPPAAATQPQGETEDDFASLVASLSSEAPEQPAEPPAEPQDQPGDQAQEIAQPPSAIPDDVMSRAVQLGIPAAELFRRDPQDIPAFVAQVEQYQSLQAQHQAAARSSAPPPAFDLNARVKHYKDKSYDDQVAQDLAEKDAREHQLHLKVLQLEQQFTMQSQRQAQQQAAVAVGQWNEAVASGLRAGSPALAALADDPAAVTAIQAQSQKLGQMYYSSGQPMPGAAELAQQAALMVYGADLLARSATPYASATPRPRGTVAHQLPGKDAAIAHIARVLNSSN